MRALNTRGAPTSIGKLSIGQTFGLTGAKNDAKCSRGTTWQLGDYPTVGETIANIPTN